MSASKKPPAKVRLTRPKQTRRALTHSRIMRYGVRNFTRNAWLTVAATAVMTVTLLIIFATVLASQILSNTAVNLRDKIDISIYFDSKTDDDTLRNLRGKMCLVENVQKCTNSGGVTTSNGQSEYDKYVAENKDNKEIIGMISRDEVVINLPAVMHVKVNDLDNLQSIRDTVENDPQFQKWLDQNREPTYDGERREAINTIAGWASLAQQGGLIAGAVFLLISILVIFNTIRMAIFSRREEIDMMKSVGADRSFIRGPFLIEAEMYGILAALIATALGYAAFMWLAPGLSNRGVMVESVADLVTTWWWLVFLAMMAVGIAIGYISARLSARRYLK
jgi:cell division transport system permease protein